MAPQAALTLRCSWYLSFRQREGEDGVVFTALLDSGFALDLSELHVCVMQT